MTGVVLAVEDVVSETVAQRLLDHTGLQAVQTLGLKGKGYLKNRARELNRAARVIPILMIVDQDRTAHCAVDIISEWIDPVPREDRFLLRVATMEVESWILADRDAVSHYLGTPVARIPMRTDTIGDPKQFLVNLARKSSNKRIRDEIVPRPGSTAVVGAAYNPNIQSFVRSSWNPIRAARCSESLERAMRRINALAEES
jgi:hypothetical protein